MKIVISNRFKRSYKKYVRKFPQLQENIDKIISLLSENPFSHNLITHKLSGELFELYACKCGYDCRIIFSLEDIPTEKEKIILLIDICTHEDVY